MGALLALASAACYGVVDYAGGMLARRASAVTVAWWGQLGGLVAATAVAMWIPAPHLSATDLAWGAVSGVGTGLGMVFLFRGAAHGAMSVVMPVSAVASVALPVLIGVTLLHDRPSLLAWSGIAAAIPALALVSLSERDERAAAVSATRDGLFASVGIATQYLALAQAASGSGLWPVASGRVAAIVAVLPLLFPAGQRFRLPVRQLATATAIGAGASFGLMLYLLATRERMLSIVVVLASLYPAVPVLLGIFYLRERLTAWQATGLAGACLAVVLLTLA